MHWCTNTHTRRALKPAVWHSPLWADPSQALRSVRPAINSQTISHSPQGIQQHWARTTLTMCVGFLETREPDSSKDHGAAFGQKCHLCSEQSVPVPNGESAGDEIMLSQLDAFTQWWVTLAWCTRAYVRTVCYRVTAKNERRATAVQKGGKNISSSPVWALQT